MFLLDVGDYLSITLKKEKLQKETNFKREKLLKDVESILDKLSPPLIEEEEEEQGNKEEIVRDSRHFIYYRIYGNKIIINFIRRWYLENYSLRYKYDQGKN